ncbi:hypothetical protein OIE50_38855 [Streptomyces canus]|uniref:hypothetical protein n=1 Tax=Streptomyces canus TaxID=58343 RepID=UPI0032486761
MEPHEAVDAVIADLRDHRITVDGSGLFTTTRQITLLCHIAARMPACMAATAEELEDGVVDGCSPWAYRGEAEPVQDDFELAS